MLADAFSEFIAAAGRLEASYGELQEQVAQLGHELAERNAALNDSLQENERMRLALEQIVDSLPCGVLVIDRKDVLAMINPEGMRLLGVSRGASAGQTLADISAEAGIDLAKLAADAEAPEGEHEFSLAAGAGARWIAVRNRRLYAEQAQGGSKRPGAQGKVAGESAAERGREARLTAVHGGRSAKRCSSAGGKDGLRGRQERAPGARSGDWQQTILIVRDVTTHKQAELERERGRRATALAEIAAMLAHEIRNPLASLELFAGLIGGSEVVSSSSGPELEWISHMQAGIRSLAGTVNNVLSFHGVGFPSLAPLNLFEAIESSVAFVRPIAAQSGVALALDLEGDEDASQIRILGNTGSLQQLLLNLVSNAVRHTPKGGSVRIALRKEPPAHPAVRPSAVLSVADTGSGIRAEHLGEIFRAGFSASGNTSGLGLAVCSQIVRQLEGELRVTSQPGSGSTFFVELPTL